MNNANVLQITGPLFSQYNWLGSSSHRYTVIGIGISCEFIPHAQNGAQFVLTSVIMTFDPLPWCFVWTSLLSIAITPDNWIIIRWQEHCEKGLSHTSQCISLIAGVCVQGMGNAQVNGQVTETHRLNAWAPLIWHHQMETFSVLLANCVGNSTGDRWIPRKKASDAEL